MSKRGFNISTCAIIGKPNVGKSSLFNRLAKKRKAIVTPQARVTRDINYETIEIEGKKIRIADTAGHVKNSDNLQAQIYKQTQQLIDESDSILFLCSIDGLTAEDQEIAEIIRKSGKPSILAVNKIDNSEQETELYEFARLGFDPVIPISALHNRNISILKNLIFHLTEKNSRNNSIITNHSILPSKAELSQSTINVAIVGRPNVGKSSLLNMILGKQRALVTEKPGTTRDAVDELYQYGAHLLKLIDTAGIRKRSKISENVEFYSYVRAQKSVTHAHIGICVIDVTEGITQQDKKIVDLIIDKKKGLLLVLNKWDLLQHQGVRENDYIRTIRSQFPHISYAQFIPLSATTGYNKSKLLKNIIIVYNNYTKRLKTKELNTLFHSFSLYGINIKYGYQKYTGPPTFELFVNNLGKIREPFIRFIENKIRREFKLYGTPIEIGFRK